MSTNAIDDRVTELEVKLSFQENAFQELSSVVQKQHKELDELRRQLEKLDMLVKGGGGLIDGTQEKPPHY